jgi:hypothetical protein
MCRRAAPQDRIHCLGWSVHSTQALARSKAFTGARGHASTALSNRESTRQSFRFRQDPKAAKLLLGIRGCRVQIEPLVPLGQCCLFRYAWQPAQPSHIPPHIELKLAAGIESSLVVSE